MKEKINIFFTRFKNVIIAKQNKLRPPVNFKTIDLFAVILTSGVIAFMFYFFLLNRYNEFLNHNFINLLFDINDKYMDFFNPLSFAIDLNVYAKHPGLCDSPFFLYILHGITKLLPNIVNSPLEFRYTNDGKIIFAIYTGITLILFAVSFNELFRSLKVNIERRIWLFVIFILSYPVIFAIDRGNYVFLTASIIALFIVQFINKKTLSAAVLLGIAIALKYYPVVFGIIFIVHKKWREALICALVSCVLLFFCLAQFQGGLSINFIRLLNNLTYYQSIGKSLFAELAAHNTSIYMLFDVPSCLINKTCGQNAYIFMPIHNVVKYIAASLLIITAGVCFIPKIKLHDCFLLLTAGLLLFPLLGGDYMITIIIVPAIFWILSEQENNVMPWLTGLYFISKRYIALYNFGSVFSITIQSILNPLILLSIIIYILWLRRGYLQDAIKNIREF